jgi:hypothetical protein
MHDPLLALSRVKFLESQFAGEELNEAADKQEATVNSLKDVRKAQETYDAIVADNEVTEDERAALFDAMETIGLETPSGWKVNGSTEGHCEVNHHWDEHELQGLEENEAYGVTAEEAEEMKATYESYKTQIQNVSDGLEDEQALQEFDIQCLSDKYTNASNMMSTHQAKMDKLREEIQRRIDG